jgi:hypothetical protein
MAALVRIAEGAGLSMKIPRVLINRAGTTGGCGVLHPVNKSQERLPNFPRTLNAVIEEHVKY